MKRVSDSLGHHDIRPGMLSWDKRQYHDKVYVRIPTNRIDPFLPSGGSLCSLWAPRSWSDTQRSFGKPANCKHWHTSSTHMCWVDPVSRRRRGASRQLSRAQADSNVEQKVDAKEQSNGSGVLISVLRTRIIAAAFERGLPGAPPRCTS